MIFVTFGAASWFALYFCGGEAIVSHISFDRTDGTSTYGALSGFSIGKSAISDCFDTM